MPGEKSDLVFTDPPYGVAIGQKNQMLDTFKESGRNKKPIENDNKKVKELFDYLKTIFILIKQKCKDKCSIYVCSPSGGDFGMMMMMMMRDADIQPKHHIIWNKSSATFSLGRLDYDYKHEAIIYTWTKRHEFYGKGKHKTTVWDIPKPQRSKEHPTMKPVELVVNAIENSSKESDVVLDAFTGSGSTLIACEQTERAFRGIEIDPHYVDVIVQRWVNFTGIEKIKKNGKEIIWKKSV